MKVELGATRIVLVFKHFVIKIPNFKEYRLFLYGLLANHREKTWSGRHKDLAKVIYTSPLCLFVIMERAEVLSNDIDWRELQKQLKCKYRKDEYCEFLLSDCKPSNWGYIKGKLKKIDYGG